MAPCGSEGPVDCSDIFTKMNFITLEFPSWQDLGNREE